MAHRLLGKGRLKSGRYLRKTTRCRGYLEHNHHSGTHGHSSTEQVAFAGHQTDEDAAADAPRAPEVQLWRFTIG